MVRPSAILDDSFRMVQWHGAQVDPSGQHALIAMGYNHFPVSLLDARAAVSIR